MPAAAQMTNIAEFTVSELSFAIKRTVEDAFGLVRLRAEISGYRGPHSSGHAYFALKDDRAKIDAVVWRGTLSGLKFKPEEGLEVIVTGRVTTFPGKSSYQIVIEALEPAGVGALMALLEERKKKLAAEGLFDEARKKPRPFWPRVVGIVTSPTGAVIRDMLHGFEERCPVHVIVWPVRVQGETCAGEVAAAIRGFNALRVGGRIPRPDLLIVARGGGSLEDLWGFNEEIVARAAAESAIPLISAVGHETDWTLIDLVADFRAPTPTKAAEWAVPRHSDLLARLMECGDRLRLLTLRRMERARTEFRAAERAMPKAAALLSLPRQRLDVAGARLGQNLRLFSHRSRARLDRCAVRLSPRLILNRVVQCRERVAALSRDARQCFVAAVAGKNRRFAIAGGRFSPRLIAERAARGQERVSAAEHRKRRAMHQLMRAQHLHLNAQGSRLRAGLVAEKTLRGRDRLATSEARSQRAMRALIAARSGALDARSQLLRTLSHRSVLERGFALVRRTDGTMIARKASLGGEPAALEIEFADGRVSAHTQGLASAKNASMSADKRDTSPQPYRSTGSTRRDDGGQGSLL